MLLCLLLLPALICGCAGNASPPAAPTQGKQKLPIEVEKGPEDALLKNAKRR
jgi:hypothetical protein